MLNHVEQPPPARGRGGGAASPDARRADGGKTGPTRAGATGLDRVTGLDRAGDTELAHAADTFQMLASATRLQIVCLLAERELCVSDLAAAVGSTESAVSHHLRQLRQMRIVRARREGRQVHYRLDDDHIAVLLEVGLAHVRERLR